jgi:hypothetical protein
VMRRCLLIQPRRAKALTKFLRVLREKFFVVMV